MTKVIAVIPIKTNNQRLPGKNTKILGNKPLYDYIFTTIQTVTNIDEIWIDSSDETILKIAKKYKFNTLKRPIDLNKNNISGHDLINFEIDNIKVNDSDIFVQIFVTQPFLKSNTIESAIQLMLDTNHSSVLSLYPIENRFWYNNQPVSHNPLVLKGTQFEEPIYCEAGFYIFNVRSFKQEKSRVTKNHITYNVDPAECLDIDNLIDFKLAEVIINEN